jgi:hypothetical protein
MRSLSGRIGARGFRIGAPLLSLAASVLPLIGYGRLTRRCFIHGVREHDLNGEEPARHAG